MDDKILQAYIHCYSDSDTAVLILNREWELLWSNGMGTAMDIESAVTAVKANGVPRRCRYWQRGIQFECRLLNNEEDGCRILEIQPAPSDNLLKDSVDEITAAVQSMTSACHVLHGELDEQDLYDQMPLLNLMISNCYRINRLAYMQKELDRLTTGQLRRDVFSVQLRMRRLYDELRNILRVCAKVEMDLCEDDLFLTGDSDFFSIAVMAGIVICYRDFRHYQQLSLSLQHQEEIAVLTISVSQKPAELPPTVQGMGTEDRSGCEAERALLNAFCELYGGSWMLGELEGTVRCTMRFKSKLEERGTLILHSPREQQEGGFYNKYEILLSRIHLRQMF